MARDELAFTCQFESVRHVILHEDLPYVVHSLLVDHPVWRCIVLSSCCDGSITDINDDTEDRGPLLVAIANIEGIVCGMGDPTLCVRLDAINPAPVRASVCMPKQFMPLIGLFVCCPCREGTHKAL